MSYFMMAVDTVEHRELLLCMNCSAAAAKRLFTSVHTGMLAAGVGQLTAGTGPVASAARYIRY